MCVCVCVREKGGREREGEGKIDRGEERKKEIKSKIGITERRVTEGRGRGRDGRFEESSKEKGTTDAAARNQEASIFT